MSLKLALFPLHVWLPNAYAFAPSVATAFLAATATKVAVYLMLRFLFSVFGVALTFESLAISEVFITLSLAAMFGASIVAIFQENVKRMLAYSSVAQIGYITLGIGLANQTGLTGGIVHLFNHAMMKGALFLLLGIVIYRIGTVKIEGLAGLGKRMPITMGAFVIAGLSIIGTPGTVGFRQQMVSGGGGLRTRLVVAGVPTGREFSVVGCLYWPHCRGGVVQAAFQGGQGSNRATNGNACSSAAAGCRDSIFRYRYVAYGGRCI